MDPPITTLVALLQALRDGPAYGQDLIRRVCQMTEGALRLSPARVYPCLHSLQREGLVTTRVVTPGKRRGARSRTYYELTPLGVEVSSQHRSVFDAIVRRGTGRPPPSARLMAKRLTATEELSASSGRLLGAMQGSKRHGQS